MAWNRTAPDYPIAYRHEPLPDIPMRVQQTRATAAATTDAIYLVGMTNDGFRMSPVQRLRLVDLAPADQATWEALPDCIHPAYGAACAVVGGRLYMIGGGHDDWNEGNIVDTVSCYDLSNSTAIACPPLPLPLKLASAAASGAEIHITGGLGAKQAGYYFIFDTVARTWRRGPDMPTLNYGHGSFVYDDKLYVFGGVRPPCCLKLGETSWTTLPEWPGRLNYPTIPSAAQAGRFAMIYLATVQGLPGAAWAFDVETQTWTAAPDSVPQAASNGAAAASVETDEGIAVYLMGGGSGYATVGPSDPDLSSWPVSGAEYFGYDPRPANSAAPLPEQDGEAGNRPSPSNWAVGALFGPDDRIEVNAISDPARRSLARGVAAIVSSSQLTQAGTGWTIEPYGTLAALVHSVTEADLAPDQKFGSQPLLASGTCFRVGPRLLATNAHILCGDGNDTLLDLTEYKIVFDWVVDASGAAPHSLNSASVYTPVAVKRWSYQFPSAADTTDWALVEVDRDIDASIPLISFSGSAAAVGDFVWVVGHSSALPAKYSTGQIKDVTGQRTIELVVASFTGSSGSPLFNAANQVVGIVSKGPEQEWTVSSTDQLARAKVYDPTNPQAWITAQKVADISRQLMPLNTLVIRIKIGDSFWAGTTDLLGGAVNRDQQDFGWTRPPFFRDHEYQIAYTWEGNIVADIRRVEIAKAFHAGWGTDQALVASLSLLLGDSPWFGFSTDFWVGTGSGSALSVDVPARWSPG